MISVHDIIVTYTHAHKQILNVVDCYPWRYDNLHLYCGLWIIFMMIDGCLILNFLCLFYSFVWRQFIILLVVLLIKLLILLLRLNIYVSNGVHLHVVVIDIHHHFISIMILVCRSTHSDG